MSDSDVEMIEKKNDSLSIEDSNFDKFVKDGFNAIRNGIKSSNSLPAAENFNYYECFATFNDIRKKQIKSVVNSMHKIIRQTGIAGNIKTRDVEEKFDLLVGANDFFLDRAEFLINGESGFNKSPAIELIVSQTPKDKILNGSWNKNVNSNKANVTPSQSQAIRLLAAKNVQRPQLTFSDKIDNSYKSWKPNLKYKPNALRPLLTNEDIQNEECYHPYEFELNSFNPLEKQLKKRNPTKYKSLEETQLIIIEKLDDLKLMIKDLESYDEIAVDLEHHSYRSFLGITCLIQISTKDTDYLVDSLALRSELHLLNEIFTKPSILKVFHGADSDIQWLQRDFSIYVVNMFDTYQAAKQLELPFLSLAYLMKTYCNINPNKHFQLADWRIRPLPDELIKYAREDTHYLIYIKDILQNSLIDSGNGESNILEAVYNRSTQICKITYIKPIWTEDSYMNIYRKSQKNFNNKQLFVLKELHKWRDQTAREEDDSTNYVLPNHMLLNIAENLPREMQGVLACCNPIPPLVRQNLLKIHKIILKGREQSLIKPILETEIKQRLNQRSQVSKSYSWIYTPHDLPNNMEIRANLPCLLKDNEKSKSFVKNRIKHISIFDSSSEDENENKSRKLNKKRKLIFISPFKRYKLTLPVVTEVEEKDRNKKETNKNQNVITEEINDSKTRVYDHYKKAVEETDKRKKEITESIGRVHEHFKKISDKVSNKKQEKFSRLNKEIINNSILDSPPVKSFNQMKGKKRKRHLNSKS